MVAYNIFQHTHSGLRWVVLLLLIYAVVIAWRKMGTGVFGERERKIFLYTLIATHLQLLLGLVLFFISPYVQFAEGMMKDPVMRFYTVEHTTMMLISVILITVGYSRSKRADTPRGKYRAVSTFYLIALLLILIAIPWPFRIPEAGWF